MSFMAQMFVPTPELLEKCSHRVFIEYDRSAVDYPDLLAALFRVASIVADGRVIGSGSVTSDDDRVIGYWEHTAVDESEPGFRWLQNQDEETP